MMLISAIKCILVILLSSHFFKAVWKAINTTRQNWLASSGGYWYECKVNSRNDMIYPRKGILLYSPHNEVDREEDQKYDNRNADITTRRKRFGGQNTGGISIRNPKNQKYDKSENCNGA